MTETTDRVVEAAAQATGETSTVKSTRERSKIRFPYDDLATAVEIARVAHERYGGRCDMDQLAAALKQRTTSGAFRLKVSAARLFGVVEVSREGVSLTDLGSRIIDERTGQVAEVEAFLKVPLYKALYDRFRSRTLPGDQGLEATIRDLGVPEKQVTTARQVFVRSAERAGFFAHGRDRLVAPATTTIPEDIEPPSDGGAEDDASTDHEQAESPAAMKHPLIVGLVGALPEPGQEFSHEDREVWLQAAEVNFSLIYGKPTRAPAEAPRLNGSTSGEASD